MKKLKALRLGLPGKALLIMFSLMGMLGFNPSFAQTKGCVKADFDFEVDNSSKTAKFEAKTSGNVIALKWDFGDGDDGSGKAIKHTYDSAGHYKVCLTAYGYDSSTNTKCSTTVCKRVTITGCTLQADFGYKTNDLNVVLEAKSNSKNAVYGWVFGDGNSDRGRVTKHTYSREGKYNICLVVKDTVTGCVVRICKDIKVEDKDSCKLEAAFDYRTDDLTVKLFGKTSSKNAVIGWTFGDGNSARGEEVKHTYKKEGKYTVCLIAKDTVTGCVVRICKDVKVEEKDSCNLKAEFTHRTDDLTVKLFGKTNSKNAVIGWTFGDGNSARGEEVKHTYKKEGKYTICLIAKDTVTGCVVRECVDVNLGNPCNLKADFEFAQDGNEFKFRAKANHNDAKFTWDFGDGEDGSGAAVGHKYRKPGVYEVCVSVYLSSTNKRYSGNCRVKICKRVVVKETNDNDCKLKADFAYEIDGNKIKVKAKANEENVVYFWSWGDGTSQHKQKARHEYKKPGVYEVCLIVFNPKTKCKVCVCKKIVIERPCKLKADFKYKVKGNVVQFKGRSNSKDVVYGWSFGDGTSQRGKTVRHKYAAGTYTVTLIAKDTATGCVVTEVRRIIINKRGRKKAEAPAQESLEGVSSSSEQELNQPDQNWVAKVYPVPSTTEVAFDADKELSSVKVYNSAGNEIITSSLTSNERIDISTLPTGYYFAHLLAADGSVKIVKFVKN